MGETNGGGEPVGVRVAVAVLVGVGVWLGVGVRVGVAVGAAPQVPQTSTSFIWREVVLFPSYTRT